MERYSHVFDGTFIRFDNMYDGYCLARRNKRYLDGVLNYSANLEDYIHSDIQRLKDHTYKPGHLNSFYEYYPKVRLIHALPFQDRVINCAAYRALWPIYSRSFYEHSYGSIPYRGTIKAVECAQRWMQMTLNKPDQWYMAKMDIAKFFFRVPLEVQLRELGRPLDDPDMMWFLETAIRCDGRAFGLPVDCTDVTTAERIAGIGMQVGSLISQTTANVVLTPLDHHIKRVLHAPYYERYMDDMLTFCRSKQQAWDIVHGTDEYLRSELGLQLNNKTAVIPVGDRIEFVGRMITPYKVEIRKKTSLQMMQHLTYVYDHKDELPDEYCSQVIGSYLGLMSHCDCDELRDSVIQQFGTMLGEKLYAQYA